MTSLPTMIIVGADKGGVGKTTICRALLDYLTTNNRLYRAFDTETPDGNLKRFFPGSEIVNLTVSDDQMKVFDNLSRSTVTVLDIRAGLLSPSLKTLGDIGFLEMMRSGQINIVVFHVIGSTISSLSEIKATAQIMTGAKHFIVKNHTNDSVFFDGIDSVAKDIFNGSNGTVLDIPKLDERAAEYVEAAGLSFDVFSKDEAQSLVLRGKVKHWLSLVYKQFDLLLLD